MTKTVLVDYDGTLADTRQRKHLIQGDTPDWRAYSMECAGDRPVRGVIELLDHLTAGYNVIVWSGGLECSRKIRERWLSLAHVRYTELILRPDNDRRDNVALKLDYLKRLLAQGFKPVLAIDDYPAVLEALSARGIKGLLVARDGVSSFRMKRSVGGDEEVGDGNG